MRISRRSYGTSLAVRLAMRASIRSEMLSAPGQGLDQVGEAERALQPQLELGQRSAHLSEHGVGTLKLLQRADDVRRRRLLERGLDLDHPKLRRQPRLDVAQRVGRAGLLAAAAAAAARAGQHENAGEER
eukprot:scaffold136469_cov72-Phaeocystis_antarctica.AAC.3